MKLNKIFCCIIQYLIIQLPSHSPENITRAHFRLFMSARYFAFIFLFIIFPIPYYVNTAVKNFLYLYASAIALSIVSMRTCCVASEEADETSLSVCDLCSKLLSELFDAV